MIHSEEDVQRTVQAVVTAALDGDTSVRADILGTLDREMSIRVSDSLGELVAQMIRSAAADADVPPLEFWQSAIAQHGRNS